MKKIKITFLFLFAVSFLFSQKNEFGIAILTLNTTSEHSHLKDTTDYNNFKTTTSLQPVLTFNHITSKNIDFYVQGGFFYQPGNTFDKSSVGDGEKDYFRVFLLKKSVYLKLGIAKRYYYERLVFISGINIPFQFQFYQKSIAQYYYYDSTNKLFNYHEQIDKTAPMYITGLNIHQSVYFNLCKGLYIGMDLNLGFQTIITSGIRHYNTMAIDYQNNNSVTSTNGDIPYSRTFSNSLNFQPTIGVRYQLPEKSK